ncbi:MAG: nucleotide disphospho-sugar-binding domain-containing protein, partial [Acidobacteriota bacterium]
GPLLLETRRDRTSPEDRAQLQELYDTCRDRGQKLIYAAFGSFFTSNLGFLRRLAATAAERPDWELVISLGGKREPAELGELPERVHAFRWLPQLEVLQHASVAITHGGINTLDECVLAGVPMLIYCGYETDMAGNTSRVVHHGLGLAGEPQDTAATIRERIDRLLSERSFRDSVQRMRSHYRAYTEFRVAERTIARWLKAQAP